MPAHADFSEPDPNDRNARLARNNRLSVELAANDRDITDIYLETLPSGKTRWWIVYRDGTKDPLSNP